MALPSNPFDNVPHPLAEFQLKQAVQKASALPQETLTVVVRSIGYTSPVRWRTRLAAGLIRWLVRVCRLTPVVEVRAVSTVSFPGFGPVSRERKQHIGDGLPPLSIECYPFTVFGQPTIAAHIRNSLHAHQN